MIELTKEDKKNQEETREIMAMVSGAKSVVNSKKGAHMPNFTAEELNVCQEKGYISPQTTWDEVDTLMNGSRNFNRIARSGMNDVRLPIMQTQVNGFVTVMMNIMTRVKIVDSAVSEVIKDSKDAVDGFNAYLGYVREKNHFDTKQEMVFADAFKYNFSWYYIGNWDEALQMPRIQVIGPRVIYFDQDIDDITEYERGRFIGHSVVTTMDSVKKSYPDAKDLVANYGFQSHYDSCNEKDKTRLKYQVSMSQQSSMFDEQGGKDELAVLDVIHTKDNRYIILNGSYMLEDKEVKGHYSDPDGNGFFPYIPVVASLDTPDVYGPSMGEALVPIIESLHDATNLEFDNSVYYSSPVIRVDPAHKKAYTERTLGPGSVVAAPTGSYDVMITGAPPGGMNHIYSVLKAIKDSYTGVTDFTLGQVQDAKERTGTEVTALTSATNARFNKAKKLYMSLTIPDLVEKILFMAQKNMSKSKIKVMFNDDVRTITKKSLKKMGRPFVDIEETRETQAKAQASFAQFIQLAELAQGQLDFKKALPGMARKFFPELSEGIDEYFIDPEVEEDEIKRVEALGREGTSGLPEFDQQRPGGQIAGGAGQDQVFPGR